MFPAQSQVQGQLLHNGPIILEVGAEVITVSVDRSEVRRIDLIHTAREIDAVGNFGCNGSHNKLRSARGRIRLHGYGGVVTVEIEIPLRSGRSKPWEVD